MSWTKGPSKLLSALTLVAICAALLMLFLFNPGGSYQPGPYESTSPKQDAGKSLVYFSLGDSLSQGVQPTNNFGGFKNTDDGYSQKLIEKLGNEYPGAKLVLAGCGGATTRSLIEGGKSCQPQASVPYRNRDRTSGQLRWITDSLKTRGESPNLVSLSIGGNDLLSCWSASRVDTKNCLRSLRSELVPNWKRIAKAIANHAGGKTVLLVNTIYDPYVVGTESEGEFQRFRGSAFEFHRAVTTQYNPLLSKIFKAYGWQIVDVATAINQGRRGSMSQEALRKARKQACVYTWMCDRLDIHLNSAGYNLVSDLMLREAKQPLKAAAYKRAS